MIENTEIIFDFVFCDEAHKTIGINKESNHLFTFIQKSLRKEDFTLLLHLESLKNQYRKS